MDERVTIVAEYVPVKAVASGTYLERAFWNGNHCGVTGHLPTIWKNEGKTSGAQMLRLVIQKRAPHEIPNLRVFPLAAVVTHKARKTNVFSVDVQSKESKGF